ncbi:MAG TPA: serine/threonine-protein kinase [Polyangium sp.]|nr:serine/threonine-protein kinase [Polyangium sp.]
MPNQPSSVIPIGTIIDGKYRVERYVGDGGMGQVVAARHLVLNELFAIKFMHQRDLANPQAAARFVREAQAVVKLRNNEHVARVHDVGRLETGDLYIVMELLVGQDLGDFLKRRGVLPIQEACAYVLQACSALVEAHELGIIHRDLKPANLFLTHRKDGSACIKVLDFGISKMLNTAGQEADVEMTGTREMMGSPLYMSPEQAKSARDVDGRTDIWALGAILYKLLTGKAPITGETVAEVSFALLESTAVRPPSDIRRDLPPQLEACILRCLEKSMHRRYARVTDLMAALTPFVTPQQTGPEDEDSAATVLRPMSAPSSLPPNMDSFGGTLPLGPEHLDGNRSSSKNAPNPNRMREQSGTDVMHYKAQPASLAQQSRMNAALPQGQTQPLDGHALRAAVQAQRAQERKPSFTGRVILPPTAIQPSRAATPVPQSGGDAKTPQSAGHLRTSSGIRVPPMMPPPIPPAYPTGTYPIAPAARTSLPQPIVLHGGPDATEPPWGHTQRKSGAAGNGKRIAVVAGVTLLIGIPVVLLWQIEGVSTHSPDAAASATASPSAAVGQPKQDGAGLSTNSSVAPPSAHASASSMGTTKPVFPEQPINKVKK